MSAIIHAIVYIPVAIATGAYLYRYRAPAREVTRRVAARLKALR